MNQIAQLSHFIYSAKNILIFTGAGISTESGISDYRSKGGLWNRFQPVTFQEFINSEVKRKEYWQSKLVIVNLSETPLDSIAEIKISAPIGKTLTKAVESVKNLASSK